LNISDDYQILFTGSGTTGAINHLVGCIDYVKYSKIVIYLSLYEHYSNHLPWVELKNTYPNIEVEYIPFTDSETDQGIIDIEWLDTSIANLYDTTNTNSAEFNRTLLICSISACSNINGIINPLSKIRQILNKYPNNSKFFKYFFADYACSAPYVNIDGSIFDAFFFSPHKFIGGVGTPGLLIGRSCLFTKSKPFCPGSMISRITRSGFSLSTALKPLIPSTST
jgi:selenocysteine lyase/cysteine desulfurase